MRSQARPHEIPPETYRDPTWDPMRSQVRSTDIPGGISVYVSGETTWDPRWDLGRSQARPREIPGGISVNMSQARPREIPGGISVVSGETAQECFIFSWVRVAQERQTDRPLRARVLNYGRFAQEVQTDGALRARVLIMGASRKHGRKNQFLMEERTSAALRARVLNMGCFAQECFKFMGALRARKSNGWGASRKSAHFEWSKKSLIEGGTDIRAAACVIPPSMSDFSDHFCAKRPIISIRSCAKRVIPMFDILARSAPWGYSFMNPFPWMKLDFDFQKTKSTESVLQIYTNQLSDSIQKIKVKF